MLWDALRGRVGVVQSVGVSSLEVLLGSVVSLKSSAPKKDITTPDKQHPSVQLFQFTRKASVQERVVGDD